LEVVDTDAMTRMPDLFVVMMLLGSSSQHLLG
jgi:hypothetical protein